MFVNFRPFLGGVMGVWREWGTRGSHTPAAGAANHDELPAEDGPELGARVHVDPVEGRHPVLPPWGGGRTEPDH